MSRVCFSVAVLLIIAALPFESSAARREMCWTITPTIGMTIPVGGGVDWRVGWESGLEVGLFWLGCRHKSFRIGSMLAFNGSQFHGNSKRFTRMEALAGMRFNWKVARGLFVGLRINFAGRFVTDGRFPAEVSPNTLKTVKRYINFGFNLGPEVYWHVQRWLAVYSNLDYLFSGRHQTHSKFPQHRGQPMHAFTLRAGVAFVF